jgi:orotate phosphoribosyltransferase-like protein
LLIVLNTPVPAAYSDDLREKVVAALERGEKKSQVSRMFEVSRDTIDRWLKRRECMGNVKASRGDQRGHSHCIKDWNDFRSFAEKQGDISERTIARALAHIGWSRKKRLTATENGMQPNEPLS